MPCVGSHSLQFAAPNEFAISAYLNIRFVAAINACFGFSECAFGTVIGQIFIARIQNALNSKVETHEIKNHECSQDARQFE